MTSSSCNLDGALHVDGDRVDFPASRTTRLGGIGGIPKWSLKPHFRLGSKSSREVFILGFESPRLATEFADFGFELEHPSKQF